MMSTRQLFCIYSSFSFRAGIFQKTAYPSILLNAGSSICKDSKEQLSLSAELAVIGITSEGSRRAAGIDGFCLATLHRLSHVQHPDR